MQRRPAALQRHPALQQVHPAALQRRGVYTRHNASRSIPPSAPAGASCRLTSNKVASARHNASKSIPRGPRGPRD
eukprot:7186591-Heterocapsa_arctica.AAC.1